MENLLEVERLGVAYDGKRVFSDLTFAVARGSSMAIIGPNGAGKTVLFRALIGAAAHSGTIRWAPDAKLGYVPQKLDVERDLPITGSDLIAAKARVAGVGLPEAFKSAQRAGLERAILGRQLIGSLSGGQFQRLLVALALIGDPNVLLLDEPAAGVDEPGQGQLTELLRALEKEGVTVMLISHDISVVYRSADTVLCMGHHQSFFGAPRSILTPDNLSQVYGAPLGFHVHGD